MASDPVWKLVDSLGLDKDGRKQYRTARMLDENKVPILTVSLGDVVTTEYTPSREDPDPWVGHVVELCTLSAGEQKLVDPNSSRERCGIRWLYRRIDVEYAEKSRQPSPALAPREVCWTDHIAGPDLNSIDVVESVVRVAYGALEDEAAGHGDKPADYFCRRFHWASDEVREPESVDDDLVGKYWRMVERNEFTALCATPSRDQLFWKRRKQAGRQPARKGKGRSQAARGEDAAALKVKMEERELPTPSLDDFTLDSVLPEQQLAKLRIAIADLTDEQLAAVIDSHEDAVSAVVHEWDGEAVTSHKEYEDKRDAIVGRRREKFWSNPDV